MITTLLLALAGVSLAALAFDGTSSDSPETEPNNDDNTTDEDMPTDTGGDDTPSDDGGDMLDLVGEEIDITDAESVTATDGDDTITGQASDMLEQISAGDGDDVVDVTALSFQLVEGEGGDDSLTIGGGLDSTITGGDGEDMISVSGGSGLFVDAGDGDDRIEHQGGFNGSDRGPVGIFTSGATNTFDGGAGDDTIAARVVTDTRVSGPILTGGSGSDTFELDVTTTDYPFNILDEEQLFEFDEFGDLVGPVEDLVVQERIATITDFEPGVDTLEIDLRDTHDIDSNLHTLRSVVSSDTENGTTLDIAFDAVRPDDPDDTYILVARIFLDGVSGLEVDSDVTLLL